MPTHADFIKNHPELNELMKVEFLKIVRSLTDPEKEYAINYWGSDKLAHLLIRETKD